jgi:hypothetical protein
VDSTERSLAEEAKRNMDELMVTALRDGNARPVSELLPMLQEIRLSFTGVNALPRQLHEAGRQKKALNSSIHRLKNAKVLQLDGTGIQKKVKLVNPPERIVRDKQLLDHAEEQCLQELLKLLSDHDWHSTGALLSSLQDADLPGVAAIPQFVVAYAALERALRENKCVRRTSGRDGSLDYTDEVKLTGPRPATDTGKSAMMYPSCELRSRHVG